MIVLGLVSGRYKRRGEGTPLSTCNGSDVDTNSAEGRDSLSSPSRCAGSDGEDADDDGEKSRWNNALIGVGLVASDPSLFSFSPSAAGLAACWCTAASAHMHNHYFAVYVPLQRRRSDHVPPLLPSLLADVDHVAGTDCAVVRASTCGEWP